MINNNFNSLSNSNSNKVSYRLILPWFLMMPTPEIILLVAYQVAGV
jgi:hypothetical protein